MLAPSLMTHSHVSVEEEAKIMAGTLAFNKCLLFAAVAAIIIINEECQYKNKNGVPVVGGYAEVLAL